jgi:predicted Fe-Mo cluster-binding NifX family protein
MSKYIHIKDAIKMDSEKIAIPSMTEGLDAQICPHFGHADKFVIIEYDPSKKEIKNVEMMKNPPHESGGCMRPVMLLKDKGIKSIILTGIGQRPLMGFMQQGISIFHGIDGTIRQNLEAFWNKQLKNVTESLCNH